MAQTSSNCNSNNEPKPQVNFDLIGYGKYPTTRQKQYLEDNATNRQSPWKQQPAGRNFPRPCKTQNNERS